MSTVRLQVRRDSTVDWSAENPVLLNGELGWDTTLEKLKVGDGATAWDSLPFYEPGTGGGGGGGSLLGHATYKAATDTSITRNSTAFGDVHADLAVTFTAPASGAVVVERSAYVDLSANGGHYWNLRDAIGDLAGSELRVAGTPAGPRVTAKQRVTGLTPGNAYTWKWGFRTFTAAQTVYIMTGPTNGPASLFIYDGTI